jgi:hypothetical protein
MPPPSVSVIYLCFLPYGLQCLIDFITSYKEFNAGITHDLVIVFKGSQQPHETEPFLHILDQQNIAFQQLTYTGRELDISTYYWAAKQLQSEDVFFLNTRSKILASNWLYHFFNSSKANTKTIFSATGSWQSHVTTAFILNKSRDEKNNLLQTNIKKYLLLLKASTFWWYYFPLFPNPHIRTNAFFINRKLFLSLKLHSIVTKRDAHRFESGRNSFTVQLKSKGYDVALLSKGGEAYSEENWSGSKIFWSADQENLIIADNQTEVYASSDYESRKGLKTIVWG